MRRSLAGLVASSMLLAPAAASALTVRSDRPRLLFGNGTSRGVSVSTYKTRCSGADGPYKPCKGGLGSGGGRYPGASLAAAYLATGDFSKCTEAYSKLLDPGGRIPGTPDAHSFISDNGAASVDVALVRDWCDGALQDGQKLWIEQRLVTLGDWYLANDPVDVFHDDMTNVFNALALIGLTLKDTAHDAKATAYLAAAEKKWKDVIIPAMRHEADWWHEGMTYVQPTIGGVAWWAATWSTATDDDVGKTYAAWIDGYLTMHAYALRPDRKYVYFGDTADPKQGVELFSRWLVDLLGYSTGSPLAKGLSLEIKAASRPFYDYSGADGWMLGLLYDSSRSEQKLADLPTARWLSRGAQDVAVLRSGWGPDDTYVWMTCGDYFGAHQRIEAGSFQIFKKTQLTGATGYYDAFDSNHWVNYYSQHSVHANVLTIHQPGEVFPNSKTLSGGANVNDGGQRPLRRNKAGTGFPSPDLATYLKNKNEGPHYETGDLVKLEHASCHDWVACDVTAAYNSPKHATNGNAPKVNEVTRQLVFFPPDLLVIFDRVESTDASYDKRFLLHVIGAQSTDGATYTLTNGEGKLIGQTLLPADADVNVISGFTVDGSPYPPSSSGVESGGTRLEISPRKEGTRDYFLNVMVVGDASVARPTAKVEDATDKATVTLDHGGKSYVLSLSKTGALAGHVTVKSGGATECDKDLGAEATGPLPDGGIPAEDSGTADGGPDGGINGDRPASDDGGCGCRLIGEPSSSHAPGALALLGLAAVALRRQGVRAQRNPPPAKR